jgi:hypothetical protein
MTERKNDAGNKSGEAADSDASLQNELSREAAEGADSIGDVGSNRTLSGSSSWETLPEEAARKDSGQTPQTPRDKKNSR